MKSIGILLINSGTPAEASVKGVRDYLKEFLWDPRVIPLPRLLWWPILQGFILRTRPRFKAKDYQKIWTPNGSPLLAFSQSLTQKLQLNLDDNFVVVLGMRYGKPSIAAALDTLAKQGIHKVLILPLFPQYSSATTASAFDAVAAHFKNRIYLPDMRTLFSYFSDAAYIDALVASIEKSWQQSARKHLFFSFHGLPQSFISAGDPYLQQCQQTTRLVVEKLGLKNGDWTIAFQSRVGVQKWLEPYTDDTLKKLPSEGIKRVSVICPGFAVDCLETLEEMVLVNKKFFLQAGGEEFEYIPALNDGEGQVELLKELILRQVGGWVV